MLGHPLEPLDTGVLVGRIGLAGAHVDLAGDRLVNDGLLLLVEQLDEFLFGADISPNPRVHVVQKPHDGVLFN